MDNYTAALEAITALGSALDDCKNEQDFQVVISKLTLLKIECEKRIEWATEDLRNYTSNTI